MAIEVHAISGRWAREPQASLVGDFPIQRGIGVSLSLFLSLSLSLSPGRKAQAEEIQVAHELLLWTAGKVATAFMHAKLSVTSFSRVRPTSGPSRSG